MQVTMLWLLQRIMEPLMLLAMVAVLLPAAGDVMESSWSPTNPKLSFQCVKVSSTGCRKTNRDLAVAVNGLQATFSGGMCMLNRSVSMLYTGLEDFFNNDCVATPIRNPEVRLNLNQISTEAFDSGCNFITQQLTKLTIYYECYSRSTRGTTQDPKVAPSFATSNILRPVSEVPLPTSGPSLVSPALLPMTSVPSTSEPSFGPNFTNSGVNTISNLPTNPVSTAARSTYEATMSGKSHASASSTIVTAGKTVTWRIDNTEWSTKIVHNELLNGNATTLAPGNKTDLRSKAVSSNKEWWKFFKTNEGIAVAMAALLFLCFTVCGLALMLCGRSSKRNDTSSNALSNGAIAKTASYSDRQNSVAAAKTPSNTRIPYPTNLYVDVPGPRRASSYPTAAAANGGFEPQRALHQHITSEFDEHSQRQWAANGGSLVYAPAAHSSPGSFREESSEHYAAIGDATEMLRPVEERRASAHRPSVTEVRRSSALEAAGNPTAGRGFGGMFAIEEEEGAMRDAATRQVKQFREDMTHQFALSSAEQPRRASQYLPRMSWSKATGPNNGATGYSFPVALNRRVSEMSVNTAM